MIYQAIIALILSIIIMIAYYCYNKESSSYIKVITIGIVTFMTSFLGQSFINQTGGGIAIDNEIGMMMQNIETGDAPPF